MTATSAALTAPAFEPKPKRPMWGFLKTGAVLALALLLLYIVTAIYMTGQIFLAMGVLAVVALGFWLYLSPRRSVYPFRYLFPGLLGMGLFIVLPLAYTVGISFMNYKVGNLLSHPQVKARFLDQTFVAEGGSSFKFTLHPAEQGYTLLFDAGGGQRLFAHVPDLAAATPQTVAAEPLAEGAAMPDALPMKDVIQHRAALQNLSVELPTDEVAVMAGLRDFAARQPVYEEGEGDTLIDRRTGAVLTPDWTLGMYVDEAGQPVAPGFRVSAGFSNYVRIFTDSTIREPFFRVFGWTVAFAALSVVLVTVIGVTLGALLSWEALRFRMLYRVLLIIPYAVPSFISILIFKGLFNENFGQINDILTALFGIKPMWFSDVGLARTMILVVNAWLGYPYMMLIAMGLIQAIPKDLYEAAAIDGAGPIRSFLRITAPQILRPMIPIMVSVFAFNFNNFVLIKLLTNGLPTIIGATTPAGRTDILVSYTFKLAFERAGADFAMAAAIATIVFLIVATLSVINLKLTKVRVD